jgi:hypothetical protein
VDRETLIERQTADMMELEGLNEPRKASSIGEKRLMCNSHFARLCMDPGRRIRLRRGGNIKNQGNVAPNSCERAPSMASTR